MNTLQRSGVSDGAFRAAWARLAANYLGGLPVDAVGAKQRLYAEVLQRHAWITDAILARAVTELLENLSGPLPATSDFLAFCRLAKAGLEDDADRRERQARKALPVPDTWHVMESATSPDELDETDPYACTPAERERWAREDAWIRQYARRLPSAPPPGADARALQSWQCDVSVTKWPDLTPQQRRAKERRIERERQTALALLAARFGREAAALAGVVPPRPTPQRPPPPEPQEMSR